MYYDKTGEYRWRCGYHLVPSPDCPEYMPSERAKEAAKNQELRQELPIIRYCKKAANYRVLQCPHCGVGTDYTIADVKVLLYCHGCGRPFVAETELVTTARKPTSKEAPADYVDTEVEAAFVDELKIKKTEGGGGSRGPKNKNKKKPKFVPWYQR